MKLPTGLVAIPKYEYKLTKIEVTMETKELVICEDCKHFGQRMCGDRIVGGWCFHWNGQTRHAFYTRRNMGRYEGRESMDAFTEAI